MGYSVETSSHSGICLCLPDRRVVLRVVVRVRIHARLDQLVVLEVGGKAVDGVEVERDVRHPGQDELGQHLAHAGRDREPANDAAGSCSRRRRTWRRMLV